MMPAKQVTKQAATKQVGTKKAAAKQAAATQAAPPPTRPRSGKKSAKTKGILLTPGAGSGRDHHTLVAIESAVAPLPVTRVDFPYRKAGRKAPDRQPVLLQSVVDDAAAFVQSIGIAADALALGGRSMGGRMCSIAVAEGLPAAGLILISYPLHPPGKPDNLRIAHFPSINVPCLFISGDRDSFGTRDELEQATRAIRGPVTHVWIAGGRHELNGVDGPIVAAVSEWLANV